VTSQSAVHEPTTLDEWGTSIAAAVGKGFEEDIRQMMEWFAAAPENKIACGTVDPGDDHSWEDLGVKASTFRNWLGRTKWTGPADIAG
jgi:hypothetical protein